MCPRSGLIPRAILTFDQDGRLTDIEADASKLDSIHGIEFFSGILVPGLVNAHCHLELSYLKGAIPPGTGLEGFVHRIAQVRHELPEEERVRLADVQDTVMRQEGVIAVGDICNDAFTFPVKQRSKIHYHNFIELFGSDPSVAGRAFAHGQQVAEQADRARLAYSLTPHATYSLSEPLFEQIVTANPVSKPLSIHFMESEAERQLFRNEGPFADRFRREGLVVDWTHFHSPAGRLVASIPAETPLLLIHNTFVSEEDIDLIQGHFHEVTWVVCPRSNDYIEGSFPPVDLLQRKGCRIAIGTDSLSSNTSLSLIEELKLLSRRKPEIPFEELIKWQTWNGAQALGIGSWAGSFEPGKSPGAVLVDHIDWNRMTLTSESTARRIL